MNLVAVTHPKDYQDMYDVTSGTYSIKTLWETNIPLPTHVERLYDGKSKTFHVAQSKNSLNTNTESGAGSEAKARTTNLAVWCNSRARFLSLKFEVQE